MSKKYFKNFPVIQYEGHAAVNLLRRVDINDKVKNYWTTFYPYEMKDDDRIEHIAFNYYDNVDLDWLIYLANDITDPWYDVALSNINFDKFIKKKYTSIRVAQNLVVHYKNNYEDDDQIITSAAYEALSSARKKYWTPVYTYGDNITGYERTKKDQVISTNKIQNLSFANTPVGTFVIGEWISSDDDAGLSAQITWANTSAATIQHIIGDWSSNTNVNFTGEVSGAVAQVNGASVSTITNVIPEDEQVYFSPVTSYDYELALNETKRELNIINKNYVPELEKQIKDVLK